MRRLLIALFLIAALALGAGSVQAAQAGADVRWTAIGAALLFVGALCLMEAR